MSASQESKSHKDTETHRTILPPVNKGLYGCVRTEMTTQLKIGGHSGCLTSVACEPARWPVSRELSENKLRIEALSGMYKAVGSTPNTIEEEKQPNM